jgi:hypothetical protein
VAARALRPGRAARDRTEGPADAGEEVVGSFTSAGPFETSVP